MEFPLRVLLSISFVGLYSACGKTQSDGHTGANGGEATGGLSSASGGSGITSGGAALTGGGALGSGGGVVATGGAGGVADCMHPPVVERCEGDYCRIEPGCFIMGAPEGEFGRALVNSDQVQVTLTRPFWIGRTEVTRAQWDRTGLPRPPVRELQGERECLEPDCPQGNLTVYLAFQYANRLSEMAGLEPCYLVNAYACTGDFQSGYECPQVKINAASPYECEGYRLPMEAEWEYAARAGTTTSFPTGNITEQPDTGGCYSDAALEQIGWYCMNSPEQTQPVAQKPPNAWGLHDMHGNVWEVVNDLYGPSGYLAGPFAASEGPLVNPTGAVNAPDDITRTEERPTRVKRGGSHVGPAVYANVSRRLVTFDYGSGTSLGLRVARTIFE